jgi:leucine dehydrogenase
MFEERLRDWDGEEVALRFDGPTGAWMIVAVHDTILGPAMGGTRMKVYVSPDEALADGLRLAQAMTLKQAAAGLPFGGGKAVLAVEDIPAAGSAERRGLMLRYGTLVDALGGTYVTAADMNTGPDDLDVVAERTPHVLGCSSAQGGAGSSAPDTAIGVFHGIRASVARAFGAADLEASRILVQGVGAVGAPLARLLRDAGASLILTDTRAGVAEGLAAELGASTVAPHDAAATPCDVISPCATGRVLSAPSIARLRCRIVAGAANNQLVEPADAARLAEAGILYAPDFVVNAGGVLHLAGYERLGWDGATMAARLAGIGDTLVQVFADAERDGITTADAAERMALARIAAGREDGAR